MNADQPRRIDHTSLALGEMREFMTHHRQQMDKVTERLVEHSDCLKHLQSGQDKSMLLHDRTQQDVKEIKDSVALLVDHHQKKKTSKKSLIKGIAIGVVAMTVFAAIYYKDSALLQIVYRHTIGLML